MLPKPYSCLSDALLVSLDFTMNLECLEQKTSSLSPESGLFTVSPSSDNGISVGQTALVNFLWFSHLAGLLKIVEAGFAVVFFKGTLHEADVYFREEAGICLWGRTFHVRKDLRL